MVCRRHGLGRKPSPYGLYCCRLHRYQPLAVTVHRDNRPRKALWIAISTKHTCPPIIDDPVSHSPEFGGHGHNPFGHRFKYGVRAAFVSRRKQQDVRIRQQVGYFHM